MAVSAVPACGDEGCVTDAPDEVQGSLSGMGWQDTLNQVDTHRSLVAPAWGCCASNEDAIAKANKPVDGDVVTVESDIWGWYLVEDPYGLGQFNVVPAHPNHQHGLHVWLHLRRI